MTAPGRYPDGPAGLSTGPPAQPLSRPARRSSLLAARKRSVIVGVTVMVAQIVALVASGYSVIALVVIPLGVLAVGFIIGLSIWLVRRLRGTDFVQDVAADAEQLGLAAGAALMVSVVTAPPVRTFVNPLNMVRPSYWRNTHVAGGLVISPDGITFIRRGYARSGHAPEQFARIDIRAAGVGTLLGSSAALEVLTTAGQHSFYVTRKEAAAIEDALIACGIPLR